MSIAGAFGYALGSQVYVIRQLIGRTYHLSNVASFQAAVVCLSLIAFVAMLMPLIFINEKKYCEGHVSSEKLLQAVKAVFRNKDFVSFALGNMIYWVALTIIMDGINYFIMTLLQLKEEMISMLILTMMGLSFVFYIPINLLAKKFGKKRIIMFAFVVFIIDFALIIFLNKFPISTMAQAYIMVILASIPLAIFNILPAAIIADIAESDGIKTGNYKEALFFGTNGLVQKIGIAFGNFLVPSFLLLGKSVDNPTGIRVAAVAALLFCIGGLLLYRRYDEKGVMKTLQTKENID